MQIVILLDLGLVVTPRQAWMMSNRIQRCNWSVKGLKVQGERLHPYLFILNVTSRMHIAFTLHQCCLQLSKNTVVQWGAITTR